MFPRIKWLVGLTLCALLLMSALACSAAPTAPKYPTKPIDLIAGTSPGGGGDTSVRLTSAVATRKFGVPANVTNVSGASGVTAVLQVSQAAPDGYMLLGDGAFLSSYMFAASKDLPMKLEDRTFIAQTVTDYSTIIVNADSGLKTPQDVVDFIKAKPDQFKWGAGQFGSNPMFSAFNFFAGLGIDSATLKKTKMVVFDKGNTPSMQAVAAGDVHLGTAGSASLNSILATGRVKALCTLSPKRLKFFPDVPAMEELGFKAPGSPNWYGVSGPKNLPASIAQTWSDMLKTALTEPESQAEADKLFMTIEYLPGDQMKANVLRQYEESKKMASDLGLLN